MSRRARILIRRPTYRVLVALLLLLVFAGVVWGQRLVAPSAPAAGLAASAPATPATLATLATPATPATPASTPSSATEPAARPSAAPTEAATTSRPPSSSSNAPITTDVAHYSMAELLPAIAYGEREFLIESAAGRYALLYDTARLQAVWVAHLLTRSDLAGERVKRSSAFRSDPQVVERGWATAHDAHYKGSGYDRGHLLPSADRAASREENRATFYLSNASPQCPSLNRGEWRMLEEQVREWARAYDSLYVVTGTLWEGESVAITGGVGIPSHYYKALLLFEEGAWQGAAYLLPNRSTDLPSWEESAMPIDALEERAGRDFFAAGDGEIERAEATLSTLLVE